jgi:hypothetical protein
MRLAMSFLLALALVPAALSAGELPPDVQACAPGDTRGVVERFVRAFNAGSIPTLDRVFAPANSFNWYSTGRPGVRVGPAAYDRSTLMPYFRARLRQSERLRLVRFKGNGNSNRYGHFEFLIERRSRELRPTVFQGKGAAICAASGDTISVWSVGGSAKP